VTDITNPTDPLSRWASVRNFATTGAWDDTARLMFTVVTARATPTSPETRAFMPPRDLVAAAEKARREWLAGEGRAE